MLVSGAELALIRLLFIASLRWNGAEMADRLDPRALRTVTYEVAEQVATVTLNRPEAMNSFDQTMCDEFAAIWAEVKTDDDVHVVVLRAAGDRAFCTGVDVKRGLRHETNLWS